MKIHSFPPLALTALLSALMLFPSCRRGAVPALENGRVRLAFDAESGWPVSMTDKAAGEEMLADCVPLWEVRDRQDSLLTDEARFLGCRRRPDGLQLSWKTASGIRVQALARLAPEGGLALFLVNIGEESLPVAFALDPALYALPASCQAFMTTDDNRVVLSETSAGPLNVSITIPARSIRVIEFDRGS